MHASHHADHECAYDTISSHHHGKLYVTIIVKRWAPAARQLGGNLASGIFIARQLLFPKHSWFVFRTARCCSEATSHPDMSVTLLALLALLASPLASGSDCTTWYETTQHGPGFRNVSAYGATGNGVTDDTAAILAALTQGQGSVVEVEDGGCTRFVPECCFYLFIWFCCCLRLIFIHS